MIGRELSFCKIRSFLICTYCDVSCLRKTSGIFVSLGTDLRFEPNNFDAYLNHVTALKKDLPELWPTRTVASYAVTSTKG